jgi:hypothetical protein
LGRDPKANLLLRLMDEVVAEERVVKILWMWTHDA